MDRGRPAASGPQRETKFMPIETMIPRNTRPGCAPSRIRASNVLRRARPRSGLWSCRALALLLLLLGPGVADAQTTSSSPSPAMMPKPMLARPWATGVHCPLLLPCADSDDTALHILYRLAVSQPTGA